MRKFGWLLGGSLALGIILSMYSIYSAADIRVQALPTPYKYRIMFISPELGNPYWNPLINAVKSEAKKEHISIEISGSNRMNAEEMQEAMNMAIASRVDGIILLPINDSHITEMANKATVSGIPVFTVINDIPTSLRKSYIGTDHIQSGVKVGKDIAAYLNGKGNIGVVKDSNFLSLQELRLAGIKQALKVYQNIHLIELSQDQVMSRNASQQTDLLLNEHPDLSAFIGLGQNDSSGIVASIEHRSTVENYAIYSFDYTEEAANLMRRRAIVESVEHDLHRIGLKSVQQLSAWLEGKQLPLPTHSYTNTHVISSGIGGN